MKFELNKEESFGSRLTKALNYRDMRPHDLAVKMGVTDGTISQYRDENGIDPKIDRVAIISNILQVNPVWLLGYSVPMEFEPKFRKPTQEELDIISAYHDLSEDQKNIIRGALNLDKKNTSSELSRAVNDK